MFVININTIIAVAMQIERVFGTWTPIVANQSQLV